MNIFQQRIPSQNQNELQPHILMSGPSAVGMYTCIYFKIDYSIVYIFIKVKKQFFM